MQKDFYLNERSLAAYFEKDWFDQVVRSPSGAKAQYKFAPFDSLYLYSNYHEKMVEALASAAEEVGMASTSMLEVGSSLGRTYYEVCRQIPSMRTATLIEPSENLSSYFDKIFTPGPTPLLKTLTGNLDLVEIPFPTREIHEVCRNVKTTFLRRRFQEVPVDLSSFDLVICSNVIDQCEDHLQLMNFLKNALKPGGILVLSCTYQWQSKYIGNASYQIKNIHELFSSPWRLLKELNLPFQFRVHERHWLTFLSHVGIYRK